LAFAAAAASTPTNANQVAQVAPQPDGSAPPQLFTSTANAFSPLPFTPPTAPKFGDPFRTDVVAVDVNQQGQAWVGGVPVGRTPTTVSSAGSPRVSQATAPSPLVPLTRTGTKAPCDQVPANRFTFTGTPQPGDPDSYLWTSISVVPPGPVTQAGVRAG